VREVERDGEMENGREARERNVRGISNRRALV